MVYGPPVFRRASSPEATSARVRNVSSRSPAIGVTEAGAVVAGVDPVAGLVVVLALWALATPAESVRAARTAALNET